MLTPEAEPEIPEPVMPVRSTYSLSIRKPESVVGVEEEVESTGVEEDGVEVDGVEEEGFEEEDVFP
jgi:hypothetical protein